MTDVETMIEKYVASWNNPDAGARRQVRVASLDQNHNAVRYRWEMIPTTGGEPDSIGTHVAMLGADGCLLSDHQFIDQPPSAG
jgi:hypothetical protein